MQKHTQHTRIYVYICMHKSTYQQPWKDLDLDIHRNAHHRRFVSCLSETRGTTHTTGRRVNGSWPSLRELVVHAWMYLCMHLYGYAYIYVQIYFCVSMSATMRWPCCRKSLAVRSSSGCTHNTLWLSRPRAKLLSNAKSVWWYASHCDDRSCSIMEYFGQTTIFLKICVRMPLFI